MAGTRRLSVLTDQLLGLTDFPPGPKVVAVSGGADSAACAFLAKRLESEGQLVPRGLRAVHVHHGLAASDALEAAATKVAAGLGIEIDVARIEVTPFSEGSARRQRYRAMIDNLESGEWLVTGHTSDDQAETVLGNILRGTGLDGLSGIPARRPPVARPILGIDRSQTRELATLAGLDWLDDPSNQDLDPIRNRLRMKLIPQLEASFNPGLRRHLIDLAASAADVATPPVVTALTTSSAMRLPRPLLRTVTRAEAIRSIREALRPWKDGYAPTRAELERVMGVVTGEVTATELHGGLRVETEGPWLVLTRAGEATGRSAVDWRVPGTARWGSFVFEAVADDERPAAMPISPWQAVLDSERIGEVLRIEEGSGGRPLVTSRGEPVWEPGRRVYRAGWVDGSTRRYLSAYCVETWER